MKIRILGFALALTVAVALGACENNNTPKNTKSPSPEKTEKTSEPAETVKPSPDATESP